jgi:hypothetical protein
MYKALTQVLLVGTSFVLHWTKLPSKSLQEIT